MEYVLLCRVVDRAAQPTPNDATITRAITPKLCSRGSMSRSQMSIIQDQLI